jgi:mono/diheme cytochrome c family protein
MFVKNLRVAALFLPFSLLVAAPETGLTFHKQVLPILQNHCQECHRPGEAAPMSFLSYKETRPYATAIRQAVASKRMPPWHADPHFGKFSNDRSLTPQQIQILSDWASTGAKEGDPADAPAPRQFTKGWNIPTPDAVIEMPFDHPIPAKGTVEYTYIIVPTGFTEDKWVEKIEVRPGDASVVHHAVLYSRPPQSRFLKGVPKNQAFAPKPDNPGKPRPDNGQGVFYGLNDGGYEMVSVYVPGGLPYETKPGQARLIPAGSDLVFQMHYTTNGKATTDRSRVGIVFAKQPPKERVVNTFVANFNLHIPPMADNHRVDGNVKIHRDVVLQNFFPHMHVRGKAFEYEVTYPSGEKEMLLKVPAYDFNWQLTYQLAKPVLLPKGSQIRATAWFDNSPNNKSNPDPKQDVYWGEQTWEEMLAGFVDFVIPVGVNPAEIAFPARKAAATQQ